MALYTINMDFQTNSQWKTTVITLYKLGVPEQYPRTLWAIRSDLLWLGYLGGEKKIIYKRLLGFVICLRTFSKMKIKLNSTPKVSQPNCFLRLHFNNGFVNIINLLCYFYCLINIVIRSHDHLWNPKFQGETEREKYQLRICKYYIKVTSKKLKQKQVQ